MTFEKIDIAPIEEDNAEHTNATVPVYMRLANTDEEIRQAQLLRYKVFYEEYGAIPSDDMKNQARDFDEFDDYADHLIVIATDAESGSEKIIGTYRLLRQESIKKFGRFYSSDEYDLEKLVSSGLSLLEVGRSCVLSEYRTRPVLNMLWEGIAGYIIDHKIDILFGCASFQGTDTTSITDQLSYLYHFHPTPPEICPRAVADRYINMNIIPKENLNARRVFASLPPLIKGYLRLGASIGDGAVIDTQFNTTDVCIVVQTNLLSDRYRKHYERKLQKTMHGYAPPED